MLSFVRAGLVAAILALSPGGAAADALNLLVMGEDADPDTIRRHTPIFDRVRDAVASELRGARITVFDETAVTMEFYDQGRVRRPDTELISLARSVQIVPIDAVATFQIYAAIEPSPYEGISDLRIRVSGRVIAVADGQSLGGYEVHYGPGDLPMLPLNCDRDCVIAFVGDQAVPIARDVGAALAAQLADLIEAVAPASSPAPAPAAACPGAQGYTLAFKGFSPEELARFDLFLAAFQGYAHHRPLTVGDHVTELWYETCAPADRLEGNLRAMVAQTGAEVWLEAVDAGFSLARLGPQADQD